MFPYTPDISVSSDLKIHYSLILETIGPILTESRRQKIDQVVQLRNFSNPIVLESIYDRGNISAVMRSSEAFGFANFHVIETQEKFKESHRVTQGADKWLEVQKWKQSADCIKSLKSQGIKLAVTTLEGGRPIDEVDFSKPTALVLGNEKNGISAEMLAAADEKVIIPMFGFVQSFNISVAGALCSYHMLQDRMRRTGRNSDLTEEQQLILKALYYLRTLDSAEVILKEKFRS